MAENENFQARDANVLELSTTYIEGFTLPPTSCFDLSTDFTNAVYPDDITPSQRWSAFDDQAVPIEEATTVLRAEAEIVQRESYTVTRRYRPAMNMLIFKVLGVSLHP
jgi:hypothetical protein